LKIILFKTIKLLSLIGISYVFTDGGSYFYPYSHVERKFYFSYYTNVQKVLAILASNASIWHTPHSIEREQDEEWGFLYQIDHLNASTGEKFTRVLHCSEIPKGEGQEDENCTTLDEYVILKNVLMSIFSLNII
jgi:hypothetical protein